MAKLKQSAGQHTDSRKEAVEEAETPFRLRLELDGVTTVLLVVGFITRLFRYIWGMERRFEWKALNLSIGYLRKGLILAVSLGGSDCRSLIIS